MARVIRPSLLLLLAAAVTMALLVSGVLGGSGPAAAGAATARHDARTHHAHRHSTRHHSTTRHARTAQAGDIDNVQAGDQTSPDTSRENESAGVNANEPAGEAQPGHEDPNGHNVDHQCSPDCAPGELP